MEKIPSTFGTDFMDKKYVVVGKGEDQSYLVDLSIVGGLKKVTTLITTNKDKRESRQAVSCIWDSLNTNDNSVTVYHCRLDL